MRNDAELIDAVRGGNHTAFAELVHRYQKSAASTAWNILWDYHATQDATQNAFVEVFRQIGQLRNPSHFGAWVMQITRREALRIAQKTGRVQQLDGASDLKAIQPSNPIADHHAELLAAIGGLPEQERVVVGLRYLEGHSVAEISSLTGRPVGTVTKQLSRAILRLKSTLREVYS